MHWAQKLLLVQAGLIFLGFTVGYRRLFARPEGTPPAMRTLAVLAGIVTAGHVAAITDERADWWSFILGTALYGGSAGLYLWAARTTWQRRLSLAFSGDQPAHLVTSGPYRWVRHPFYSAYLLYWCAGVVAAKEPWLIPTVGLMAGAFFLAARGEEAKFAATDLAADYARYQRRVGMFLPWPGRR